MLRRVFVRFWVITLLGSAFMGAGEGDDGSAIHVVTVCQALTHAELYTGKTVVVVGRWTGTGEGSWLTQECGVPVVIDGHRFPATIWTSYSMSAVSPPEMPRAFRWNKPLIREALNEVKRTTRLQRKSGWYAIYGRLVMTDGPGLGHLNAAPAELIWPAKGGYLNLK